MVLGVQSIVQSRQIIITNSIYIKIQSIGSGGEKKKIRRSNDSAISQPKLHNSKTEKKKREEKKERKTGQQTDTESGKGWREGGRERDTEREREKGTGRHWNRQSNLTQISYSARVKKAALYVTDIPESVHNQH